MWHEHSRSDYPEPEIFTHYYSYENANPDEMVHSFFVRKYEYSDNVLLFFKVLPQFQSAFVNHLNITIDENFPCDRDALNDRTFAIKTSDRRLIAYLITKIIQISPSFLSKVGNLADGLSIDLAKGYKHFPDWVKHTGLMIVDGEPATLSSYTHCKNGPIKKITIMKIENEIIAFDVHLKPEIYAEIFLKAKSLKFLRMYNHTTYSVIMRASPKEHREIVAWIGVLDSTVGGLRMLTEELMMTNNFNRILDNPVKNTYTPLLTSALQNISNSVKLIKHGYDPMDMPAKYIDPFFNVFIDDPVIVPGTELRCDRAAFLHWLENSPEKLNPISREPGMKASDLKPDSVLKQEIDDFVGETIQKGLTRNQCSTPQRSHL